MARRAVEICLVALALAASACREREQAWIVVELENPGGPPIQMAFNNPRVPNMTLTECERSIPNALPKLQEGIEGRPETKGRRIAKTQCVMSVEDPLKPK